MQSPPGANRRPNIARSAALRGAVRKASRRLARLGVAVNAHGVALMSQVLMQGLVL
jgi:hypothetical protein